MLSAPVFLRERPWLLQLVHVVSLFPHFFANARNHQGWLEIVPVPLLTQFPNFRRFNIQSSDDLTEQTLSPSRRTLSALRVYSAPIQHLELFGITFLCIDDLMRYLSAFPNLSHLLCQSSQTARNGDPLGADCHYNLKLTHLVASLPINQTCTITDVRSCGFMIDKQP